MPKAYFYLFQGFEKRILLKSLIILWDSQWLIDWLSFLDKMSTFAHVGQLTLKFELKLHQAIFLDNGPGGGKSLEIDLEKF